jgi:hypothetical protein
MARRVADVFFAQRAQRAQRGVFLAEERRCFFRHITEK